MTVVEREQEVAVPVVVPATKRDVLHRAADLLGEFGWWQGGYCPGGNLESADRFCAAGAIRRSIADFRGVNAGLISGNDPLLRECLSALGMNPYNGIGTTTVADWNDKPGRTKAEVVARLREAAERAA